MPTFIPGAGFNADASAEAGPITGQTLFSENYTESTAAILS
jgi:hypothetical protein